MPQNRIETYDANTIWNKRGKPPIINIDPDGRINFSVEAVNLLKLKENMKIAFRTDKADRGIIYFYEQATGIPLVKSMECKTGTRLSIYCRPLAEKLLSFFGYDKHKSFLLTEDTLNVGGDEKGNGATKMWFVLKSNIHIPIDWRKKS